MSARQKKTHLQSLVTFFVRLALGVFLLGAIFAAVGALYRPQPGPFRLSRQRAELDGRTLSYHQSGSDTGTVDVVLLHGGMGSAEDFEPILPLLGDRLRLFALDRPGFGFSEARGDDATYPGNARRVLSLVRALGLRRPLLVGHSHGGGVALRLLEDAPEAFSGAVLLAPAAYPAGHARGFSRCLALPYVGEGMAAVLGPILAPRTIRALLTSLLGPNRAAVGEAFIVERVRWWNHPHALAVHARQDVTDRAGLAEQAERYGQIQSPVVVVMGELDSSEGRGLDSPRLASSLPHARLIRLPGTAHYVQFAEPQRIAEIIREAALTEAH